MRNRCQNVTKNKISELKRHQKGESIRLQIIILSVKVKCDQKKRISYKLHNTQRITILPSYLQFTMMLAVAVAAVPTPLLAMH